MAPRSRSAVNRCAAPARRREMSGWVRRTNTQASFCGQPWMIAQTWRASSRRWSWEGHRARSDRRIGPRSGVRRQDRAGRCRLARREREPPENSIVAKEALAPAEDDGIDHEPELVDEIVREERCRELGAPDHEQRLAVLASELRHGLGDVGAEQHRVLPGE